VSFPTTATLQVSSEIGSAEASFNARSARIINCAARDKNKQHQRQAIQIYKNILYLIQRKPFHLVDVLLQIRLGSLRSRTCGKGQQANIEQLNHAKPSREIE
jgi:hypothetical protein